MLRIPVANSNTAPPTRRSRLARSSRLASDRSGGQANSLGMTDHSLASSTGTSANPSRTWVPWLTR